MSGLHFFHVSSLDFDIRCEIPQFELERMGTIAYLIPTPPAIKTTFLIVCVSIPLGGQTKLPPTRILIPLPRISSFGFQSHAAGGFDGESWTANST